MSKKKFLVEDIQVVWIYLYFGTWINYPSHGLSAHYSASPASAHASKLGTLVQFTRDAHAKGLQATSVGRNTLCFFFEVKYFMLTLMFFSLIKSLSFVRDGVILVYKMLIHATV